MQAPTVVGSGGGDLLGESGSELRLEKENKGKKMAGYVWVVVWHRKKNASRQQERKFPNFISPILVNFVGALVSVQVESIFYLRFSIRKACITPFWP